MNQHLLSAYIDENGQQTDYEYDGANRLTKVTDPADIAGGTRAETLYAYDGSGRLQSVTDPEGTVTTSHYDARSRRNKITYNDGTTERWFYGSLGSGDEARIVKRVDRRGAVTNFEFDATGRKTKTTYAAAVMDAAGNESAVSDPSVTIEETLTYLDGTDRVATRVRAGEKTEYIYDYNHRLVETWVHPNTTTTLTTKRAYLNNQLFSTEDPYGRKSFYATMPPTDASFAPSGEPSQASATPASPPSSAPPAMPTPLPTAPPSSPTTSSIPRDNKPPSSIPAAAA